MADFEDGKGPNQAVGIAATAAVVTGSLIHQILRFLVHGAIRGNPLAIVICFLGLITPVWFFIHMKAMTSNAEAITDAYSPIVQTLPKNSNWEVSCLPVDKKAVISTKGSRDQLVPAICDLKIGIKLYMSVETYYGQSLRSVEVDFTDTDGQTLGYMTATNANGLGNDDVEAARHVFSAVVASWKVPVKASQ